MKSGTAAARWANPRQTVQEDAVQDDTVGLEDVRSTDRTLPDPPANAIGDTPEDTSEDADVEESEVFESQRAGLEQEETHRLHWKGTSLYREGVPST